MKRLIFTSIILLCAAITFGQNAPADSAKNTTDTTGKKILISYGHGDDSSDTSSHHSRSTRYPKGFIGITLSRLDLGLATLMDHGSFTLSQQNQFLSYRQWKTSNVGFDVFQMGIKFDNYFKIYVSGGFDWTLIRLHDNITTYANKYLPKSPLTARLIKFMDDFLTETKTLQPQACLP